MKEILIFFVAHWYLSLFFQTFFLHRYAAHKAFTMSPFVEKVVYVLTWIFQGSNYLSPLWIWSHAPHASCLCRYGK
jgi:stearoyl-CoA desaturase (delta-9 desaturase)